MYRCHVPMVAGVWAPGVHTQCWHNERAGLLTRTLGPTPEDGDMTPLREEFRRFKNIARKLQLVPWSTERVAASYSGRLAKRYAAARESLELDGLPNRLMRISAFVKAEKFCPMTKGHKPRMIMARAPEYNLQLMTRLKPLERSLWRRIKGVCPDVKPTRQVGKGLSPPARASLILDKMGNIGSCAVFEVDGKAFEAHVTRPQLELEHSVYKAAFPRDETLSRLLHAQLELRGKTSSGIRFRRAGCRASGDPNTGLGNTLIMLATCRAAMGVIRRTRPNLRYDLLADGDNCLLFLEEKDVESVRIVFAETVSSICAHELAVEEPEVIPERVVFGQSKPVKTSLGWTMVRDPIKTLSHAFTGHRHFLEPRYGMRVLKAVALAETWLNAGVPVLGPYFLKASKLLSSVDLPEHPADVLEGWELLASSELSGAAKRAQDADITPAARLSYEKAFGVSPEEQVLLEERLTAELSFDHYGPKFVWPLVDVELGADADNFDSLEWLFHLND